MEQPFSTSKVTVEYFDPHGVFKLLAPGLVPRLPLRNLHWQSHAGPLRSIDTLHVELVAAGDKPSVASPVTSPGPSQRADNDGFQTQIGATASLSNEAVDQTANRSTTPARRHQIPGLRRTPYLKVLLVRCDDNDSYKGHVRQEIRDWFKANSPTTSKKVNTAENHDAFEWLIVHVVIPNTVAATQPRKSDSGSTEKTTATSRWRPGSSTLFEKLRSDFNSSSKSTSDRVAQIRIGVNDVPYDILPRVVPAVPTGYTETEQETENSWTDLIAKFRGLILSSFDLRVSQYEEDIKEKDAQRTLPGWNFCTFFILKEGLARGFESVGLVEDALVGYDELSVGLDMIIQEQSRGESGSATNTLLDYTDELKQIALQARKELVGSEDGDDDEVVDMQSSQSTAAQSKDVYDDIPISSTKKPYRDMIVANNVSVFDFRCYIFSRQLALLLRLGNAWSTRAELLAKLKEQQESILHGVAPRAPPPKHKENVYEDLSVLAQICRRTLEFVPSVSQIMRKDIFAALLEMVKTDEENHSSLETNLLAREVVDNLVASFAFSVAQQILAQTSTKALPIPTSSLASADAQEPKASIPEPKTMMHPARSSSLRAPAGQSGLGRPPSSPNAFPGRRMSTPEHDGGQSTFLKAGLEELAAKRAELYALSRNILEQCGKKRGWTDGWANVPVIGESSMVDMVDIDLDGDNDVPAQEDDIIARQSMASICGIDSRLLKTALENSEDFYRLYEILTDKTLRHYTVANHTHSIQASMADIAVLKYHMGDFASAASYFWRTTPFFGESGWSLLELSMLVMYSRCLKQLERKDEYVKVLLKLLSKAAAAERDQQRKKSTFRIGQKPEVDFPGSEAIKGFLIDLISEAKGLSHEVRMPLSSFFYSMEIIGSPEYHDGRDSFSVHLSVTSLLVDQFTVDKARMRITSAQSRSQKEIWLEQEGPITIQPGRNVLKLRSNAAIPGSYEIDRLELFATNLGLYYERDIGQIFKASNDLLKSPSVSIYHRANTLDIRLHAAKHIQLDLDNTVDVELDPGWNDLMKAEIRVKAATGGLRLLTSEAKCLHPDVRFSNPSESGLFCLESIPTKTPVRVRFPYTLEQEASHISIRIEVSYVTDNGNFIFSKTPTIQTALALGVNVQDVFKHKTLFSRFTVSTASASPLRLFNSELVGSDLFESEFGVAPADPVTIFPKQPASLLYKIRRKPGSVGRSTVRKTMYLKLYYSVLHDEVESLVQDSVANALESTPWQDYSRLLTSTVAARVRNDLSGLDLERASLLGSISTAFLEQVNWAKSFVSLGKNSDGSDYSTILASFLQSWQAENPTIALSNSKPIEPSSISIPVDIPSVTIVHTADIRLQTSPTSPTTSSKPSMPSFCTHQLLPATLHLKWTRMWDTEEPAAEQSDIEFSYDLAAPVESWLLGGRRKGHFVIPAPTDNDPRSLSSSIDTEAEIPILMIPLREGWLPYPSVDIREVPADGRSGHVSVGGSGGQTPVEGPTALAGSGQFETDFRNMGEAVRVVADRSRVTLSLDASGPGGGPLVLDVERRGIEGRVVA
ncbi:trafficking protein particle complex subunit 10 [Xylariaceae sp. FL0016]|nr:trafficking protein particle complex subunit 10 [Xylariaceae sp. FL0016]